MLLEISDLNKEYIRNKNKFSAVRDITFSADAGEFICIVGHSGCGKSTLFHMIAGLLKPTGGTVMIDRKDVHALSHADLSDLRSHTIGYVLQGDSLLDHFTVLDNVCMPAYLSRTSVQNIQERALLLLSKIGLKGLESSYPSTLSGGEARRAAIVRAMMNEPKILIADEPTSNLDPENSSLVLQFLHDISEEGTAVLISTHDMEALNYAHTIYRMNHGTFTA